MMRLTQLNKIGLSIILILLGCINGGSHGSVKSYSFNITKGDLDKIVYKIINSSGKIRRDSTRDYYNDGISYITFDIKDKNIQNSYTFRYGGNKTYWDTSKSSSIFIAYAWDNNGNGGNEGDLRFKPILKKNLIHSFESCFISKINKELPSSKKL